MRVSTTMSKQLTPAEIALRDGARDYHNRPTPGKISVTPTKPLSNQRDLSLAYFMDKNPAAALETIETCRRIYPNYYYAGFFSMFGMMTGTISSGVLLLREVDSELKTPAANNLLVGSAFAILLGGPMLLLVGIAPNSTGATFACLGICVVYMAALLALMLKARRRVKN